MIAKGQWVKVVDWGCNIRHAGTLAMLEIASRAAKKQRRGEPWKAMALCHEYAMEKGKTQWAVWTSIRYALIHSRAKVAPLAAIDILVAVADEE